ncbi:pimeloyl-ACP methyl ester carboxylesterase [Amorphus suaedae]
MAEQNANIDTPGVALATSAGISFLRRSAAGAAVVFLHGIGSRGASFLPLIPHLHADLDLIFWNAPGYDASAPLAEEWPTEEAYATALLRLFDALGLDQVLLVGHSLGTLIAARFAMRHGDRLSGLVLSECAAGYGVRVGDTLPEKTQARIDALEELGGPEFARTRAARLVHDPKGRPEAVAAVEAAMGAVTMPGYGQAVRMLSSGRLAESLAEVSVPTTFIWAEGDVVTPEAQTLAAIEARSSNGADEVDYHQIADAGHAVYLEQPAAFASVIASALAAAETRVRVTS